MRSFAVQQLALAVRQRADLDGQQNAFGSNSAVNPTDSEMLTVLNSSYGTMWDLLTQKFPENYSWGDGGTGTGLGYYFPIVQGKYLYNAPFDLYKIKGIDLSLDQSGINWASVRPYNLKERNLFSFPLFTTLAYAGWQNMRWQLQGNRINLLPQVGPLPGIMRMLYTPACPTLCASLPIAYPLSTLVTAGELIYASVAVNSETAMQQVYAALNGGTTTGTAPTWTVPGYGSQAGIVTDAGGIQWAYQGPLWNFTTTLDGISGYEELVILDAAIKFSVKFETDAGALMSQLQAELAKVNAAAENRNSGDPMTVSGGFGLFEGGPAYGNGFGPGGSSW